MALCHEIRLFDLIQGRLLRVIPLAMLTDAFWKEIPQVEGVVAKFYPAMRLSSVGKTGLMATNVLTKNCVVLHLNA